MHREREREKERGHSESPSILLLFFLSFVMFIYIYIYTHRWRFSDKSFVHVLWCIGLVAEECIGQDWWMWGVSKGWCLAATKSY